MTPAEHYAAAEADQWRASRSTNDVDTTALLASALVHATLAQAGATIQAAQAKSTGSATWAEWTRVLADPQKLRQP